MLLRATEINLTACVVIILIQIIQWRIASPETQLITQHAPHFGIMHQTVLQHN